MGLVKVRAAMSTLGGEQYQRSVEFFGPSTLLRFPVGQLLSGMVLPPVSTAACRGVQRCCELALNALASVLKLVLLEGRILDQAGLCAGSISFYSP